MNESLNESLKTKKKMIREEIILKLKIWFEIFVSLISIYIFHYSFSTSRFRSHHSFFVASSSQTKFRNYSFRQRMSTSSQKSWCIALRSSKSFKSTSSNSTKRQHLKQSSVTTSLLSKMKKKTQSSAMQSRTRTSLKKMISTSWTMMSRARKTMMTSLFKTFFLFVI